MNPQFTGLGLSVACMNYHNTAVHSNATPNIPTFIYDMSGRQIDNPTRGIYINEEKKYLKKYSVKP